MHIQYYHYKNLLKFKKSNFSANKKKSLHDEISFFYGKSISEKNDQVIKNIQVQNIPVVEIFVNKTLPWVKWILDRL